MAIMLYGTGWCSDCKRSKAFLAEQRIAYTYIDVDADQAGREAMHALNGGLDTIPTIQLDDGAILIEPSNADLAAALGITTVAAKSFYDLIVIGSGPSGLTAALYAAREGMSVLVIERGGVGGQAGITERLDNLPGFPEGITGAEFADRLRQQATNFGVEILGAVEVTDVKVEGDQRWVTTADGASYGAFALLVASGSTYRRLGLPDEDDVIGAGVHFCATCDGPFYRDRPVVVVGGGNSAGEESLFLTRFASSVTIVTRDAELSASKVVVSKVNENESITVVASANPVGYDVTDGKVSGLIVEKDGIRETIAAAGIFVFIGLTPNTDAIGDQVDTDPAGFIVSDVGMQTSIPGIFVAGDVRSGSTKQAVSAAGEGAAAALAIRRYVEPLASGVRPSQLSM
jgi:thioredoxin reductase (NADPH)